MVRVDDSVQGTKQPDDVGSYLVYSFVAELNQEPERFRMFQLGKLDKEVLST